MSLRLTFSVLLAILFAAPTARAEKIRFKAAMITIGEDNAPENILYRKWGDIIATQVRANLQSIIADLQPSSPWSSLSDFDFESDFPSSDRTAPLPLFKLAQLWNDKQFLQIVEGVAVRESDTVVHALVSVYLGDLKGSLSDKALQLRENINAKDVTNASDVLLLITLYAFIEEANRQPKSDPVVCALLAHADSFIKDAENPAAETTVTAQNAKSVVEALKPLLSRRRTEHACPVVG